MQRRLVLVQDQREDIYGEALATMPDRYLQCRDISHPWQVERNYHVVDANRDLDVQPRMGHVVYVRRLLVCPRCGKKRSDAYVVATTNNRWQSLELLNTSYVDPPGYLVKGTGGLQGKKDLIRGAAFRREMDRLHA